MSNAMPHRRSSAPFQVVQDTGPDGSVIIHVTRTPPGLPGQLWSRLTLWSDHDRAGAEAYTESYLDTHYPEWTRTDAGYGWARYRTHEAVLPERG